MDAPEPDSIAADDFIKRANCALNNVLAHNFLYSKNHLGKKKKPKALLGLPGFHDPRRGL